MREAERSELAPKSVGMVKKLQAGAQSFEEIGADAAWCGDPAAATASEGRDLIDRLADVVVVTLQEECPDLFQ